MLRPFLRPRWIVGHVLALLAFLTCLRLGWWQWNVTESTRGTAQNFGYALLWPVFGVAFVYMWVKFLRLELLKEAEAAGPPAVESITQAALGVDVVAAPDLESTAGAPHAVPADPVAPGAGDDARPGGDPPPGPPRWRQSRQRPSRAVTLSVATVGDDDEEDPEMTAYNQLLAALAEEDRRRAR